MSSSHADNVTDVNSIPIAFPMEEKRRRRRGPQQLQPPPAEPLPEPFVEVTIDELQELITDHDDYFSNPLVSHTVFDFNDPAIDELDRVIAAITTSLLPRQQPLAMAMATATSPPTASGTPFSYPSTLRPDVSHQTGVTYPADQYGVRGKIVKNARIYVESIDIPMNSTWPGGLDLHEEGRLLAFSITCNDPDITPTVFIENASGTTDVINDMSFKQAVKNGRGMTLSEATSTFVTPNGIVSRDVSGSPSPVFPYIKRYKDTMGGTGVYADVKNTDNDKAYVMNFEPTLSIPYQRLSFQVFNGSTLGTRMINRLEIKRLVYVDPEPTILSTVVPSDLSQLSTALGVISSNATAAVQQQQYPMIGDTTRRHVAEANLAREGGGAADMRTSTGNTVMERLYEDFIKYMYKRVNEKNVTNMAFNVSRINEQKEIQDLLKAAGEGAPEFFRKPESIQAIPKENYFNKHKRDPNTLVVNWE